MSLVKFINGHPLAVLASAVVAIGGVESSILTQLYNRELEVTRKELVADFNSIKVSFNVGGQGVVLTEEKISASPSELQGYKMLSNGRIAVIDPKNAAGWKWSKRTELDLVMESIGNFPMNSKGEFGKYQAFDVDVFSRETPVTVEYKNSTYTYKPMATFEFVEWDRLQRISEIEQRQANERKAQMFFQSMSDSTQKACLMENSVAECNLSAKNRLPTMTEDRDRYVDSLNNNMQKFSKLEYMATLFLTFVRPLDAQSLGAFTPQQTSFDKNSMIVEGYYDLSHFKASGGATKIYVMNLVFAFDAGLYIASYTLPFSDLNADPAMLRALFASFKIVK